jgi:hypothetical protein
VPVLAPHDEARPVRRRWRSPLCSPAGLWLAAPATATIYLSASGGRRVLSVRRVRERRRGSASPPYLAAAAGAADPGRSISTASAGQIVAGIKIGRLIRKAGLATAVDAAATRVATAPAR